MLIFLSFITCQLIRFNYFDLKKTCFPDENKKCTWKCCGNYTLKTIFFAVAFMAILVNLAPVGFVLGTWIEPQVVVFNVSYLFNVEKIMNSTYENQIPSIALRDMTYGQAHSLSDDKVINNMSKFESFSKLDILFLTLSSFLSYALFICVLGCTYECNGLRKWMREKHLYDDPERQALIPNNEPEEQESLDPFCMDDEKLSTKIYLPESLYFNLILLINLVLWAACVGVFWTAHFEKSHYYEGEGVHLSRCVEVAGFWMYMYSLLCTIVSCFIFSKVAYSVNRRCLKLYEGYINPPNNDVLESLMRQDDEFTKMAQQTLKCFEIWFTVHWGFYVATSFLSIALVFDILFKYIQAELKTPADSAIGFTQTELTVVGLFTLQHCFLFLYPCFKAAAVTVSREKLIKKINSHSNLNHPLSNIEKQIYVHHLKDKKFGFRISFFCARLRFGFNIAYISIFIGLTGVLLKFTDLF